MPHKGTLQCTCTIYYPPDCIHVDLTFLRWIFLGATCFIIQLSCGQHDIKKILQVQAKKPCFYYFLQGPSQVYKERLQAGERLLASMFVRREDRTAHYAVLPLLVLYGVPTVRRRLDSIFQNMSQLLAQWSLGHSRFPRSGWPGQ